MTDHDLTELLKMAKEAQAFGDAAPTNLKLAPEHAHHAHAPFKFSSATSIIGLIAAGLAAAAACTAAFILFNPASAPISNTPLALGTTTTDTTVPNVVVPHVTVADATPPDAQPNIEPTIEPGLDFTSPGAHIASASFTPSDTRESVIVAMFRTADGTSRCVRIKRHAWDCGRTLSDLSEGDLIGFAFENACPSVIEEGPENVVVLAMSGPKGTFSKDSDTAEAVAAWMESTPIPCGTEAACYADTARQYLPANITVRAETLAMR